MDSYDLVMLGILVAATLFGAFKGFAWQVASLASLVASYFVAYHFRDVISPMIAASPPWNIFTAMLAVYSGTSLVIWAGFRVVADLLDKMRLKHFDRQMGALLGAGKGVLFCVVVTFFAVTLLGESLRRDIVGSRSGHYISQLLRDADPIMPSELKTVLDPYLSELDQRLDPHGRDEGRDDDRDGDLPTEGLRLPGLGGLEGVGGGVWPGPARDPAAARSTAESAARSTGADVGARAWQDGADQFERTLREASRPQPRR